jgi:hypothetical protein
VWGILYYDTYVTAIFSAVTDRSVILELGVHASARFWEFSSDSNSMFQARSLKCIYVYFDFDCTPKFECYGAQIANGMISPVSWASHELE